MVRKTKLCLIWAAVAVVLVALFWGISALHHSRLPRKEFTRDGTTVYVEELSYHIGNEKISGVVYKPQDSLGKKPTVIYCHGLGSTTRGSEKLCKMIASKGYVAYAFDFRGGSSKSKSSGNHLEMSAKTELEDLDEIIPRIRKEHFVNGKQIYLMGHSQGALVAAMAAPRAKGVKGLILLAPAFNLPDMCEEVYPKNRQIPDSCEVLGIMTVGKRYFTDGKDLKPYKNLSRFRGDVLLIHGSSDKIVPIEYAARAVARFKSVDFQVLDGTGHSFNGADGDKMMELVGAYLERHK